MYRQEEILPYGEGGAKAEQVERMFNRIAHSYDKLNHRLSLNIDRYWRRKAIDALAPCRPQTMLDVATGTGDFALLAAARLRPARLVAVDISEGMMDIGRAKAARAGLDNIICFAREDCTSLSFADNSFDAITAAFGIRNFSDLDRGLAEMRRVMKPGGQLSIVELTRPVAFPFRQLFALYSHTLLPLYGRMVSRDASAYRYLTSTIEAFPQGERMVEILRRAGFREASFRRLTFGVCTMYCATK